MYAGTGISTDSARRKKSKSWARWTARQCKKLFQAKPMFELQGPEWVIRLPLALDPSAYPIVPLQEATAPFVVIPTS